MVFDYSKLSGLINQKYTTRVNFATKIGLSENSLSSKMNNKRPWKQAEICKACELLGINQAEIAAYFFTPIVQSVELNA